MDIQDALKKTGKAYDGGDDYVKEDGLILYWYDQKTNEKKYPVGYRVIASGSRWQPYPNKKDIRPERAGELWKDRYGKLWATRPSGTVDEISIVCISVWGTDWIKYNLNIWHGEMIHNQNGWTLIYSPDEEVMKELEGEKVDADGVKSLKYENTNGTLSGLLETRCPHGDISYIRIGSVSCTECRYHQGRDLARQVVKCSRP